MNPLETERVRRMLALAESCYHRRAHDPRMAGGPLMTDPREVIAELIVLTEKWVPSARLIVNIQAGDVSTALRALVAEREALTAQLAAANGENTHLRAALATSKDPCVYCQLPADDMARCRSGFPGCARADDLSGCPEFGAMMEAHNLREQLAAARADTERLDAIQSGVVSVECMGTTARYFNAYTEGEGGVYASMADLRAAIDAAKGGA